RCHLRQLFDQLRVRLVVVDLLRLEVLLHRRVVLLREQITELLPRQRDGLGHTLAIFRVRPVLGVGVLRRRLDAGAATVAGGLLGLLVGLLGLVALVLASLLGVFLFFRLVLRLLVLVEVLVDRLVEVAGLGRFLFARLDLGLGLFLGLDARRRDA